MRCKGVLLRNTSNVTSRFQVRSMSLTSSLVRNGCLQVTMSSPKTRNVLSLEMINELKEKLAEVRKSPEIRCVVIRGEGPAFSAGHNLKEMTALEGQEYHKLIFDRCNLLMHEIVSHDVPVIAAVDGVAAAAGCQLVAVCDIAVATEKATFSTPGSSVGLFCSTPGIPLARAVPRKISAYMLLTGLSISSDEALRSGLISKLVKDASELESEISRIVEAIRSKPKAVVSLGKSFYQRQIELGLARALEEGGQVMVNNLSFKDAQEGIRAFKEKRKPVWTHTDEKLF